MKELSIEEKAKRYDEAFDRARKLKEYPTSVFYEYSPSEGDTVADYIFPELKESEDEKIRKRIISALVEWEEKCSFPGDSDDMIAWLEKQGEQNLADKVEPKFKVGDFVRSKYNKAVVLKIEEVCNDIYKTERGGYIRIEFQDDWELMEEKSAWSEEDEEMLNQFLHKLEVCDLLSNKECIWIRNKFKALKDRVQPQNGYNPYKEVVESIAEMCKHYDKASRSGLRDFYDNVKVKCKDAKEYDSLYPQSTWKPSDEQINTLEYYMHTLVCNEHKEILFGLYSDLKKLREE